MGHRSFGNKLLQQKGVTKSGHITEESMMDSNGIRKLTEEQKRIAEESRQRLRDQVSKKMGDMLLRGYTMLDAYCNICSGILMEDRRGVRECVQCELLRSELNSVNSSVLVAEIPLNASDEIDENLVCDDGASEQKPGASGFQARSDSPLPKLLDLKEECLKELRTAKSIISKNEKKAFKELKPTTFLDTKAKLKRSHIQLPFLDNVNEAMRVVDEKLRWCVSALRETEDLERIILLQKAIRGSIAILRNA